MKKAILGALALGFVCSPLAAEETRLEIRALTQDAKFIGSSMSGMNVIVEDADTGEILDTGVTTGTTGNTDIIIRQPRERYGQISDDNSAVYVSTLDITEPRRIRVTVSGPNAQAQAKAEASSTRWVLPGKHVDAGDGWLIEVPGFAVDILAPGAHRYVEDKSEMMTITANVVMICGCPTSPGGTWDSDKIEVTAHVRRDGGEYEELSMPHTGAPSTYSVQVPSKELGIYEILVTAFDPRNGNSGVDRASFVVR